MLDRPAASTTSTEGVPRWRWAVLKDQIYEDNFHKTAMQNKVNYVKNEVLSRPATATFENMPRDLGFERRKRQLLAPWPAAWTST
ncbi:hypothetical protein SPRG_15671, partial [Saprolegnia parasitica CBS 223.65]